MAHSSNYTELSIMERQKKIIIAYMALHNFIRDSQISDAHFNVFESDQPYI